ncbi:hypothetical protein [Campylobacter anatolicus]|uniref:hypothetical protein n=1 Tax=Campylobacter anatolicus TaxID=2829105 RepID=UPI001E552D3D|nr:hypothetical protein [Campylobacter anatolicus]
MYVVTAENIDDEIRVFKNIETIDSVAGVVMVYSYQENCDADRVRLEAEGRISEILTNDDLKAEDIDHN